MRYFSTLIVAAASVWAGAVRAQTLDQALDTATADYKQRAVQAAAELNRTRNRIATEKVPLLEQLRAAENRYLTADTEAVQIGTQHEESGEQRRKLIQDLDSIRRTTTFVSALAHDGFKAAVESMAPGEDQSFGEQARRIREKLESTAAGPHSTATLDAVEFLLAETERSLGGYRAGGTATLNESGRVEKGTFVFVGPETFFLPNSGGAPGAVRPREGAKYPVSYALPSWNAEGATAFFAGKPGRFLADASGGKALRLRETTGTVWEHVKKGGLVAFVIVGVGLLAIVMIFQKVRDLAQMGVDSSEKVDAILGRVARGAMAEAEDAAKALRRSTRELILTGLHHVSQPKVILEEKLEAVLLDQRIRYERRLPLLAVIATAAPLMGLLGTVVGMVKTFALITVFGTGNAGKLSSGISEVLVATELGLTVAIPTLVAHGFLAHRIQKNLSVLERYALQFGTAVELARSHRIAKTDREPVTT